jgi:hypothetical protein
LSLDNDIFTFLNTELNDKKLTKCQTLMRQTLRSEIKEAETSFFHTVDNPKKYKYRLGQEAFPLDLTGTTNLGENGGMIKRSKITEGWGKN